MFLDGTIGICSQCAGEITVHYNLKNVVVAPDHAIYTTVCVCGRVSQMEVSRELHRLTISFLKERSGGADNRLLSDEEQSLVEFAGELNQIETGDDLVRAFNTG